MGQTNNQRLIANTFNVPLFVAAGAGSGKTTTLVERYINALKQGFDPAHMLVITFTRAAAEEMKDRIRRRLIEEGYHQEAVMIDDAWISTIDSMCERIVREVALSVGVDPDFRVIAEHKRNYLRAQAQKQLVASTLNDPELSEVYQLFGSELSGVIEEGGTAEGAGASEFAPSVPELAARIMDAYHASPADENVHVVGSAFYPDELAEELIAAYDALCAVYTKDDEKKAALLAAKEEIMRFQELPKERKTAQQLLAAIQGWCGISAHKTRRAEVERARLARTNAFYEAAYALGAPYLNQLVELAHRLSEAYQALKREAGVLDFDDLTRYCNQFLANDEAGVFRGRFNLVMVDEFQDTNARQLELIKKLAANTSALCFIGDAQQSIYKFRDADVAVYNDVKRLFEQGGGKVIALDTNFRSDPAVLNFVCELLSSELPQFADLSAGLSERTANESSHTSRLQWPKERPRILTELSISYSASGLYQQNVEQLAERIKNMTAWEGGLSEDDHPIKPGDITVLLKKNKQCLEFIRALRRQGLKAVMRGGSGFAEAQEVQLVKKILHLFANPHDIVGGLLPLFASPVFGLTEDDIVRIAKQSERYDFAETFYLNPDHVFQAFEGKLSNRARNALRVMHQVKVDMSTNTVADSVQELVLASGWIARLEDLGAYGQAQIANIFVCIEHIKQIIDDEHIGYARAPKVFHDWLASTHLSPATLNAAQEDVVTVMTGHASKGLEFPIVVLPEDFIAEPRSRLSSKPLLVATIDGEKYISLKPQLKRLEQTSGISPTDKKIWAEAAERAYSARHNLPHDGSPHDGSPHDYLPQGYAGYYVCLLHEKQAEQEEHMRMLYVALTRAQEGIVLGAGIHFSNTQTHGVTLKSAQTRRLMSHVMPIDDIASSVVADKSGFEPHTFTYNDGTPGNLRVTFQDAPRGVEDTNPQEVSDTPKRRTFKLFTGTYRPERVRTWKPSDYIHSYSQDQYAEQLEALSPDGQTISSEAAPDQATDPSDAYDLEELKEVSHEVAHQVLSRYDKSTQQIFGSAFHGLAELSAKRRAKPTLKDYERIRARYTLSEEETQHLQTAFEAWWASPLRSDIFAHEHLAAEVPFFQLAKQENTSAAQRGEHEYVSGYIDLLAYNDMRCAQIVDYKTGYAHVSADEAAKNHQKQASYYAHVLLNAGFHEVVATFVLVDHIEDSGQPLTVTFKYNKQDV